MYITAELRWFLPGALPPEVSAWFDAVVAIACVEARTDRYLVPAGDDCGEKLRQGRAQTKTRVAVGTPFVCGAAAGTPEIWSKRNVAALPDRRSVEVAKRRRFGCVAVLGGLCTLELGTVEACGEAWWTVCLEAAGLRPTDRRQALHLAAERWLTHPAAPDLPAPAARGYPAWLRERCG